MDGDDVVATAVRAAAEAESDVHNLGVRNELAAKSTCNAAGWRFGFREAGHTEL